MHVKFAFPSWSGNVQEALITTELALAIRSEVSKEDLFQNQENLIAFNSTKVCKIMFIFNYIIVY